MKSIACLGLLIAATALSGCAAHRPADAAQASRTLRSEESSDAVLACDNVTSTRAPSAAALVFSPPLAFNNPPLDLDRDRRAPSAFMGYEGPSTEYYHIETTDSQIIDSTTGFGRFGGGGGIGFGSGDRYERRAYIDKYGSIQR